MKFAEEFEQKKCYEFSSEDAYNVDMYKIEALCEQDNVEEAYETVHKWMRAKMSKTPNLDARDGSSNFYFYLRFVQLQHGTRGFTGSQFPVQHCHRS